MDNWCSFFPDKLLGVYYGDKCKKHDYQYANKVKKRPTRKESDLQLRDGVYNKFLESNKRISGYIISRFMYLGVRLLGGIRWVI